MSLMDKFLKRSFDDEYQSQFVVDNLNNKSNDTISSNNKKLATGWENYDTSNINRSCSSSGVKRPTTGWIMHNGERAYSTYRGGKKVIKTGREAMMLSMADKKPKLSSSKVSSSSSKSTTK